MNHPDLPPLPESGAHGPGLCSHAALSGRAG